MLVASDRTRGSATRCDRQQRGWRRWRRGQRSLEEERQEEVEKERLEQLKEEKQEEVENERLQQMKEEKLKERLQIHRKLIHLERVAVIRRIFWTSQTNLTQKTFQLNSYQTGFSISKQVGTSSIHGCTIAPPSSVFCVFTV
ncbi:trichohyalin-like isoform X2 [Nerophis ophidion]|uniref:trichohyalin-like isoform X2 n=1 Tax=Nerophis ophidion TaxID=159077 RepID=UPI002ADFDE75|nr:trichohyalin-like isoform X2 [Nerophis ophidion]